MSYGEHEDQVIDIYLPAAGAADSSEPWPTVLLLHGGCWRSAVDRTYFGPFARALADHGIAACNAEYRRLGRGGGFPYTFEDASAAADEVAGLTGDPELGLDPDRIIAVGHSAGGHLALWLAAREHLPAGAPGASGRPLRLGGVLALAGIPDLGAAHDQGICNGAIADLLGEDPSDSGERLGWCSPAELPPTATPQLHLVGEFDAAVPAEYVQRCVDQLRSRGHDARSKILPGSGHMEPVIVGAPPWADVLASIESLIQKGRPT